LFRWLLPKLLSFLFRVFFGGLPENHLRLFHLWGIGSHRLHIFVEIFLQVCQRLIDPVYEDALARAAWQPGFDEDWALARAREAVIPPTTNQPELSFCRSLYGIDPV
jgi:hypothetical protein